MSRVLIELAIGGISFLVGIVAGYRAWRGVAAPNDEREVTASVRGALPLHAGFLAGAVLLLAALPRVVGDDDRFYRPATAAPVLIGILLGMALILMGYWGYTPRSPHNAASTPSPIRTVLPIPHWLFRLLLEIFAGICAIAVGVEFSILSITPGETIALGTWSAPLTLLWILLTMNVVKLLDGLEGAVVILVLVGAVAICYSTLGAHEYFLNALSVCLIGAALAALRFNAYPARLSLRGPGSACAGYLFAVVTVLARQKTVAALLLVFPLFLVLILIGGAMLSILERTLFSNGSDE